MKTSQTLLQLSHHHHQLQQQLQLQHLQQQLQQHLHWQHPLQQLQNQQQGFHNLLLDRSLGKPHQDLGAGSSLEKGLDNSVSCTPPLSITTKSFASVLSLDGSVTTDKIQQFPPGRRPQPPTTRKKCTGKSDETGGKCATAGRCHCSKRR